MASVDRDDKGEVRDEKGGIGNRDCEMRDHETEGFVH